MVVHGLIAAGMEMVVARLTRGLARRGHDVGITCIEFEGVLGARLRAEGYRVTVVPTPGIRPILFPGRLAAWLEELGPDVVHAHSGTWIKAARATARAGIDRLVFTLHGIEGTEPWHEPLFNAWAARYTDVIAVVSQPLIRHLQRAHIDPSRIHVVHNGVDTDTFCPAVEPARERVALGLPADRLIIGHVARFAPVKNHAFLVDSFARVVERHPEALLVMVGDGPLVNDVNVRIKERRLGDHVVLLGEFDDLAPVYRAFDIFVLPSLEEGTSMSVLEAMATGLPVVASAVGGTPHLLADGAAGVLFESCDSAGFERAVLDLLDDGARRERIGHEARARVVSRFSEASVLDHYERLYGHAAAGSAAAGSARPQPARSI